VAARIDSSLAGIDWAKVKADLIADEFDNGRSPEALRRSFEQSQHVAIARPTAVRVARLPAATGVLVARVGFVARQRRESQTR
jgi:hypothetical protein